MKKERKLSDFKHAIPLLIYGIIYITCFIYLEKTVTKNYTVIHVPMDDYIPFCEWFVIPYFLWFAYVSAVVVYCFFKDRDDYCRICIFLFTGMTVFLLVSALFPNGQHLRPAIMPRDNFLTRMVAYLYSTDTPTNIWPSIHVYNSLGAHFAIIRSRRLSQNKWLCRGSLILSSSIILSTMFLKQHSAFDVVTAFIMAAVLYGIVYKYDIVTVRRIRAQTRKKSAAPNLN